MDSSFAPIENMLNSGLKSKKIPLSGILLTRLCSICRGNLLKTAQDVDESTRHQRKRVYGVLTLDAQEATVFSLGTQLCDGFFTHECHPHCG